MHKKLDLFFYGEPGVYDEWSPAYVSHMPYVPEMLYLIAENEPYAFNCTDLAERLAIEVNTLEQGLRNLLRVSMLHTQANGFKLNFPVFLEQDFQIFNQGVAQASQAMASCIQALVPSLEIHLSKLSHVNTFPKERFLYHILCDQVFDGMAFDYFEEKTCFVSSKKQPDGRDYIVYGFENSPEVERFSNGLLCSSNNYNSTYYNFNSFGDANGQRKDLFRFFKCTSKHLLNCSPFVTVNQAYVKLNDRQNKVLAEACGKLLVSVLEKPILYAELNKDEQQIADFLIGFEYLQSQNNMLVCGVPVFEACDDAIVATIGDLVLNEVQDVVKTFLQVCECEMTALTSLRHGVDFNEVAVELWHQLFGMTNEYLAVGGVVATPIHKPNEGRYFRSFYRKGELDEEI